MNHLSIWINYTEIPQATVSNASFLYAQCYRALNCAWTGSLGIMATLMK